MRNVLADTMNHKHTFILDLIIKIVNIFLLHALLQREELTRQLFIGYYPHESNYLVYVWRHAA